MDGIYSASAPHLTVDLSLSTAVIRPHMWLAISVISVAATYIALSGWLSWFALHLLFGLHASQTSLFTMIAGASSGFMGLFMIRTWVRLPLFIFRNYFRVY